MLTTKDGKRLTIFEDGININKNLPKWKNAIKRAPVKKVTNVGATSYTTSTSTNVTNIIFNSTPLTDNDVEWLTTPDDTAEEPATTKKVDFGEAAKMKIQDLTAFINEYGISKIYGGVYNSYINNTFTVENDVIRTNDIKPKEKEKQTLIKRLIGKLRKQKVEQPTYEFSVIDFFENVKLAGKNSGNTYKNRVEKYLAALATATMTGQTALKEKLAREMFVNKYEAELYANGLYYVVTEDQVLDFASKTEKGVDLIYLTNYARPLPDKVVEKLNRVNDLEVFDNYVILTYDPNGKIKAETEAEREKRKDPILFGLICGSDKLYYITDWIDEHCNLTLEQFVDKLEIKKADLKMK